MIFTGCVEWMIKSLQKYIDNVGKIGKIIRNDEKFNASTIKFYLLIFPLNIFYSFPPLIFFFFIKLILNKNWNSKIIKYNNVF